MSQWRYEDIERLIVNNHRVSEAVSSNLQVLLNFMPGRYGEKEFLYESSK